MFPLLTQGLLLDFGHSFLIREIKGGLVVVNVGGTKAVVIESRYRIFFSKTGLPAEAPYDTSPRPNLLMPGQVLTIGESCATPIFDKIVMEPPPPGIDVELRVFERDNWKIYVMGQIRYQDEGGADRFMGFCRLMDGDGRFAPSMIQTTNMRIRMSAHCAKEGNAA
jgi:hypothetical protein